MTLPIFCDRPLVEAADRIAGSYKNGTVGLSGPSVYPLARLLAERGNTVVKGVAVREGHVRLIAGGGGTLEILRARKLARDKRLILLPDICEKVCFAGYKDTFESYPEPETVIYGLRGDKRLRASAYAAMVGLLAECADAAVSGEKERGFFLLAKKVREMLNEPLSLPVWAELLARAYEVLQAAGGALYGRMAFCALPGADASFFTNYLMTAALIQFTKYDFNGIFIGKEKACLRAPRQKNCLSARLRPDTAERLKSILPQAHELHDISKRYLWEAGIKRIDAPLPEKILRTILQEEEQTVDNGLLASLCRAGFLDRMK